MSQADQWLVALGRHFQTGTSAHFYLEERWDCIAKCGIKDQRVEYKAVPLLAPDLLKENLVKERNFTKLPLCKKEKLCIKKALQLTRTLCKLFQTLFLHKHALISGVVQLVVVMGVLMAYPCDSYGSCLKRVRICSIFAISLCFQSLLDIHILGNCSTSITLNSTLVNVYLHWFFFSFKLGKCCWRERKKKDVCLHNLVGSFP